MCNIWSDILTAEWKQCVYSFCVLESSMFFCFFFLGEYKKIVVSSLINKCTFQLCVVQVVASWEEICARPFRVCFRNPDHIIYRLDTELNKPIYIYIYMYISKPWARLADGILMTFLLFFQKMSTCRANCLLHLRFAWNIRACFLGKVWKLSFENVVCWKFLSIMLA